MEAYKKKKGDSHMYNHAVEAHNGAMTLKWKFVVVRVFEKALTRQISEAVRTRQRGEHLILNIKGVYNRCAIPELAVKHHDRMWQEERSKFATTTTVDSSSVAVQAEEEEQDEDRTQT